MKPDNVKIINIAVIQKEGHGVVTIYGLGDDGMVYFWIASDHTWKLWG